MSLLRHFLLLSRFCEHDISSHCVFDAVRHIVPRMEKITVLKQKNATTLRHNVDSTYHVVIIKRSCTSFKLALGVVEIQVERKVRALFAVRCFIRAIAVGCMVSLM